MAVDAGAAVLEVVPGLKDFSRRLRAEVDPALRRASGNVKVDADTQGFNRRMRSDVDGSVDRSAKHVESRFGGAFRNVIGLAAGLGAGLATINFFKGAFDEAEEARKALAQTQAVLKSTGGVAKVTAGDVDRLATALSNKTGIDDEAIASGQNVLLTFTKVRNEVGKGNNIFDQATSAALDLSVALKTDLQSANILVGKALNDPIKGITALTRSGVQFTEQQKDQIKALVASGDQLGAQKIILAELNTQFAGSAAGAASPMAKLKVAFDNIKESVGTAFMPAIQGAASFLADKLPGAIDIAGRAFGRIKAGVKGVFDLVVNRDFTGEFGKAFGVQEDSPVVDWLFRIRDAFVTVVDFVRSNWKPIVAAIGAGFAVWAAGALSAAAATLSAAAPIIATVAALATLAAGIVYAYENWEGFRNAVDAVAKFLTGTVAPAIAGFAAYIGQQFSNLVGWVREHWAQISEAISHVVNFVRGVVQVWVAYVSMLWRTFGDEIVAVTRIVWDQIRNVVETVINVVRGVIQTVMALINGDWGQAWDGVKNILASTWEFIKTTVGNALAFLGQIIEGALSGIRTIWDGAWNGVSGFVSDRWEDIKRAVGGAIDWVKIKIEGVLGDIQRIWDSTWNGLKDGLGGVWEGIKSAVKTGINGLISVVNTLVRGANTLLGHLPGNLKIPEIPLLLQRGGPVPGTGSGDKVPALLEPGEFVVRKRAVQALGLDKLYEINAQRLQKGGAIGSGAGRDKTPIIDPIKDIAAEAAGILADIAKFGARALFAPIKAAATFGLNRLPGGNVLSEAIRQVGFKILGGVEGLIGEKDDQRARTAAEAAVIGAGLGGGPAVGGLTAAASGMVNAVLSRFPGTRMTSGYRSPAQNAAVGGAPRSDHMSGRAADFVGPNLNGVAAFLRGYPGIKQVIWQAPGHYDHVHGATVADTGALLSPGLNLLDNRTGGMESLERIDYDRLGRAVAAALRESPPLVEVAAFHHADNRRAGAYG